jgi:predicted O-methyltransferase YrrM
MKSLLHFCKFLIGLESPNTQVTDNELSLLVKYSREAKVIVEIGCYEGKTCAVLAKNCTGMVYTIDYFPRDKLGISYSECIAKTYHKRHRIKNMIFLKGLSSEVVHKFHNDIDFLFVDADHSYEAIQRDWKEWFPKVVDKGIIALHDCKQASNSPNYLGTMRFYEYDIPNIRGVKELDSIDTLVIFEVSK